MSTTENTTFPNEGRQPAVEGTKTSLPSGVQTLVEELRHGRGLAERKDENGHTWRDAWVHDRMQKAADALLSLSSRVEEAESWTLALEERINTQREWINELLAEKQASDSSLQQIRTALEQSLRAMKRVNTESTPAGRFSHEIDNDIDHDVYEAIKVAESALSLLGQGKGDYVPSTQAAPSLGKDQSAESQAAMLKYDLDVARADADAYRAGLRLMLNAWGGELDDAVFLKLKRLANG